MIQTINPALAVPQVADNLVIKIGKEPLPGAKLHLENPLKHSIEIHLAQCLSHPKEKYLPCCLRPSTKVESGPEA